MATRPNIVIFMTDQEQAQVSAPNHPCHTPNADRLAAEGVRFTHAYCPTAHCCPSRASLMTGLFPSGHGVFNNVANDTAIHRGVRPGVSMFSEGLAQAGYRMIYTGRWHVSDLEGPADRGWEERCVSAGKGISATWPRMDVTHIPPSAPADERPRGTIRRPGWGDYRLYGTVPDATPRGYDHGTDWEVMSAALDALGELRSAPQPWCLYVGLSGPHDPYIVPEMFAASHDPTTIALPDSYDDDLSDKPAIYQRLRRQVWGQLGTDEVREAIAHYWSYCERQDTYLGLLLDALESTGQRSDTLILKTSDHGDYVGAHGLFMKGVPAFDEGSRIPLIAAWPNGIRRPGRVEDAFTGLTDIAPTLLELAGVETSRLHGRSLVPFLHDEQPADWPATRCSQFNGVELYYTQRVVQTHEYKYVFNGFDFDELYDLTADPAEMTNRSDDPELLDIKRDLVRRMWQFAGETGDQLFTPYATVALAPWGPGVAFSDQPD